MSVYSTQFIQMIARGRITWITIVGLTVGIWVAYSEVKSRGGLHEAHQFLLYGVFGYIAAAAIIAYLFERGERKFKVLRRKQWEERIKAIEQSKKRVSR